LELLKVFGDKALRWQKSDSIIPVNSRPETVAKIVNLQGNGQDSQAQNKTEVLAEVFAQDGHFLLWVNCLRVFSMGNPFVCPTH
jgi:hypothetical protein